MKLVFIDGCFDLNGFVFALIDELTYPKSSKSYFSPMFIRVFFFLPFA
jgi:hypothetical protein